MTFLLNLNAFIFLKNEMKDYCIEWGMDYALLKRHTASPYLTVLFIFQKDQDQHQKDNWTYCLSTVYILKHETGHWNISHSRLWYKFD